MKIGLSRISDLIGHIHEMTGLTVGKTVCWDSFYPIKGDIIRYIKANDEKIVSILTKRNGNLFLIRKHKGHDIADYYMIEVQNLGIFLFKKNIFGNKNFISVNVSEIYKYSLDFLEELNPDSKAAKSGKEELVSVDSLTAA